MAARRKREGSPGRAPGPGGAAAGLGSAGGSARRPGRRGRGAPAPAPGRTPRGAATREAILEAALRRFAHYGLRRTSMEDVAREVGLSRAALYRHFASKEALFRGLSEALHERALAEAARAAREPGPVEARLAGVLEAKLVRFAELLEGSEHGPELVDENHRLCGELSARAARRFERTVARVLREADAAGELALRAQGLAPAAAAELLVASAEGVKGGAGGERPSPRLYRQRLGRLVRVFVRGLGPEDGRREP